MTAPTIDELLASDELRPPGNVLGAALWYAARGWYVFPIRRDKTPLTKHGHKDATTDAAIVRAWFETWPDANVGVWLRKSGLLAVDSDWRNGGRETLASLEAELGALPRTCRARSGSGDGSEHILFRDPLGDPESTVTMPGKLGVGVDLKVNGFVVVAPSVHKSGRAYEWSALDLANIPELPAAWRPRCVHSASLTAPEGLGIAEWKTNSDAVFTASDASDLRESLRKLGQRKQGKSSTFQAIRLIFHDYGLSVDDGWSFLVAWNDGNGAPHPEHELERRVMQIADLPAPGARGRMRKSIGALARVARADIDGASAPSAQTMALVPACSAPDTDVIEQLAVAVPPAPVLVVSASYGADLLAYLGDDDPGDDPDAWLIPGIMPAGVPVVLGGHPKSCKTFLAEHMAICLAAGIDWRAALRGNIASTAKRVRVLVLAREDSVRETCRRIWRLARGLGLDPRRLDGWLRIDSKTPFYFSSPDDVAKMRHTIESWRPALIVIDSLSRTHTGDENSKKEMSIVTSTWGDLCQLFDVTIAPIHHFTKAGEGTLLQKLRGSGDLGALVRHIIGVEKQPDGRTELSFDGNLSPLPEPFIVRMVDGTTSDGKPCIRFQDAGSAVGAQHDRIDQEILSAVLSAGSDGLTASVLEKEVTGKNGTIRVRRDVLADQGKIRKSGSRYFATVACVTTARDPNAPPTTASKFLKAGRS